LKELTTSADVVKSEDCMAIATPSLVLNNALKELDVPVEYGLRKESIKKLSLDGPTKDEFSSTITIFIFYSAVPDVSVQISYD
jgi:hypothetical protein